MLYESPESCWPVDNSFPTVRENTTTKTCKCIPNTINDGDLQTGLGEGEGGGGVGGGGVYTQTSIMFESPFLVGDGTDGGIKIGKIQYKVYCKPICVK